MSVGKLPLEGHPSEVAPNDAIPQYQGIRPLPQGLVRQHVDWQDLSRNAILHLRVASLPEERPIRLQHSLDVASDYPQEVQVALQISPVAVVASVTLVHGVGRASVD